MKRIFLILLLVPSCIWQETPRKFASREKFAMLVEDYIVEDYFDSVFRNLDELKPEDYYEVYDNDSGQADTIGTTTVFK